MAERDSSPLPSETDDEYYYSSSYSVSSEASDDFSSSLEAETILPYRFEPVFPRKSAIVKKFTSPSTLHQLKP